MTTETDERTGAGELVSAIRDAVSRRTFVMLTVGILTGYSITVLGEDVVVLPIVGSVPGLLLGSVGLVCAAVGFRRFGGGCGCSGECGDSCSYDP